MMGTTIATAKRKRRKRIRTKRIPVFWDMVDGWSTLVNSTRYASPGWASLVYAKGGVMLINIQWDKYRTGERVVWIGAANGRKNSYSIPDHVKTLNQAKHWALGMLATE